MSPLPYHMDNGGRNRDRLLLGSESEVVVLFASYRLYRFYEAESLDSPYKLKQSLSIPRHPHNIMAEKKGFEPSRRLPDLHP